MAKKTVDDDFTENIIDVDVSREMENSFLEYAYSVIYSRALPDARDGLKPVQRRILFTMPSPGPCASLWSTGTATSDPWMPARPPCVTPSAGWLPQPWP